jgi:PPOX class probable F420-dependent enzyme
MTTMIPESHFDLLDGPVVVVLVTLMPDGSPQATPVWCSRVGNQVWVNSAKGRQKDRNLRERPFTAVTALDPNNPYRWLEVRGEVVEVVEGPAAHDHINQLAQLYFGRPFTYNNPGEERVIYKIAPTRVNASG